MMIIAGAPGASAAIERSASYGKWVLFGVKSKWDGEECKTGKVWESIGFLLHFVN